MGANKLSHLEQAVASLDIELTADEDTDGPVLHATSAKEFSDDAELARISASVGTEPAGS